MPEFIFQIHETSKALNKYVMEVWSNWSYNFTVAVSLVSLWLFVFLTSRELRIK